MTEQDQNLYEEIVRQWQTLRNKPVQAAVFGRDSFDSLLRLISELQEEAKTRDFGIGEQIKHERTSDND